jgi:hypothetical protein
MKNNILCPWEVSSEHNDASRIKREVFGNNYFFYIQLDKINNKWKVWDHKNYKLYNTAEEAMIAADNIFRENGYILLSKERWDKYKVLL